MHTLCQLSKYLNWGGDHIKLGFCVCFGEFKQIQAKAGVSLPCPHVLASATG